MKICLINPPLEDFYTTGIRRQPLGLLYIASALQNAGYSPSLINCHTKKKNIMEMPPAFSYLKKYLPLPEPAFPFSAYSHYGMSWQEIEKRISESQADLYLISSMFTTYSEETVKVIDIIRKHSKSSLIAAGGHHASLYPEHLLKSGVDYVIHGEGEGPSVELSRFIENGGSHENLPNLSWLENGSLKTSGIRFTPQADTLTPPERGLLKKASLKAYGKTFISMIASRGCPNRCDFCTSRIVWGDRYRKRSSSDIVEEIRFCVETLGAEIINFEDDNLFPSRERGLELLESLIRMRESNIFCPEFTAMNGISIEKLDADIVSMLKQAGFRELNISLVSHSAGLQEITGRPFNSGHFAGIARSALSEGLNVRGYFILGLPGQSVKEADETIGFMKSLGIAIYPSVYYNVYAPESEWKVQRSSAFFNERPDFKRDDLIRCFNNCYR